MQTQCNRVLGHQEDTGSAVGGRGLKTHTHNMWRLVPSFGGQEMSSRSVMGLTHSLSEYVPHSHTQAWSYTSVTHWFGDLLNAFVTRPPHHAPFPTRLNTQNSITFHHFPAHSIYSFPLCLAVRNPSIITNYGLAALFYRFRFLWRTNSNRTQVSQR
jgi:hypothetical protein